jgi:hypothetical protein
VGFGGGSKVLVIHNTQHDVGILSLGFLATGVITLVTIPVVKGMIDNGMAVA